MSVDLKRVRETHEDAISPASKKRALGGASPKVEAEESGLEDWMRVVEGRRKEAIYRQMMEYKRASEEAARKVRQLEEQKRKLEASEHAVEVCWTQLVTVISDLVGQQAALATEEALEPVLEPELSTPAIESALQKRMPATKKLVSRFVDVAKNGQASSSTSELQQRCSKLQTETSTLRSVNKTLRSEIAGLKAANDRDSSELARAEKRLDRQRMEHDKAEASWRASGDRDRDRPSTPGGIKPNGPGPVSGHATPNGKTEDDVKPVLDAAAGMLQDTSELERLAESRLKELRKVSEENTALHRELDRLRQLAINPAEDALRSAPFFQIYLRQLATQAGELSACKQRFEVAESKLDELRNQNLAFRDAVLVDGRAEAEALRAQVGKQNSDLARLRGQRDEMQAELAERKMREENRLKVSEEVDGLAKSREERITTLVSEVMRLKGKLGAQSGSKAYLEFLHRDGVDADYLKVLEGKLAAAEGRLSALSSDPASDPRVELDRVQKDLERYKRILNPEGDVSTGESSLTRRLEEVVKEKDALILEMEETTAATNALYTEVESLAKMTDSLQSQLSSKVFDLRDADGRMSRLATEKAKADNKYFQAMRAKEAIEAECRTAQRSVEKQAKLLERSVEVEKSLVAQVATQEKGITSIKNEALSLQTQLAALSSERSQLELRFQQAQSTLSEANGIMQQRVDEAAAEKALRVRNEEEMEKAQSTIKKMKEKQEQLLAAAGGNVSAGELQMKDERDKLLKLLRCSCCEQNFKQQVIIKCGHTFCKACLDVRISTRQRKCPACGLGFAKEDVQTLYWQ